MTGKIAIDRQMMDMWIKKMLSSPLLLMAQRLFSFL
jgi:hypothetical protein